MYSLKYKREYTEKNREKINEQNRLYRLKNNDKNREWQKESRDKIRFGGLRIQVLLRDKWSCVKCGMTNEQHIKEWNREISVDHVDGDRKNNTLKNLQTLCLSCHGKKDVVRKSKWSDMIDESKVKILSNLERRWKNGRK